MAPASKGALLNIHYYYYYYYDNHTGVCSITKRMNTNLYIYKNGITSPKL